MENKRILFIDNENINSSLNQFFSNTEFEIYLSSSIENAIEVVKEFTPDLVIIDFFKFEKEIEAYPKLKDFCKLNDLKILFSTENISSRVIVDCFEAGCVDYISKPFNPIELIARINIHLDLKKAKESLKIQNEEQERIISKRTFDLESKITELNKTQEKLIESEKNTLLISLVASISHEIKTPLGICITASTFFEDNLRDIINKVSSNSISKKIFNDFVHKTQETNKIIMSNIDKALHLIESFKDMSVDQASGKSREIILNYYIEEIIYSLKPKQKKHIIELDCDPNFKFTTYPGALYQILSNLLINSFVHGFENKENGLINIAVKTGNNIEIIYRDNGCGIPVDIQDRIFDMFFTTKSNSGGSGIGMSIVSNLIVNKLGGEIILNKEFKKGTEFIITLPINH